MEFEIMNREIEMIRIRPEEPSDYEEIYSLVKEAFASAEHADGNEQELVTALREDNSYIPQLALVAEDEQKKLLGHIMFTKAKVGQKSALILAPLSVLPIAQGKGIGSALIKEGHKLAKGLGFEAIFVLGSDRYYSRFGYKEAKSYGVTIPEAFPSQFFMLFSPSQKESFKGSVSLPKPFVPVE